MKMASDRQSYTIIGKINLVSSFQKWYLFGSSKKLKWLKSNISILIFCENVGEFMKESVSCESAPQLIETGHFFRVQYKSPNSIEMETKLFFSHFQNASKFE